MTNRKFNLFFENDSNEINQVHIGFQFPIYPNYDINFDERSYKTRHLEGLINVFWKNGNDWVKLISEKNIFAYPSIDLNYVIAIYDGINDEFNVPNNAVIYNLDGSVHKIVSMPKIVSPIILKAIEENQHSNPPIEDNRYGHYGCGLRFTNFGWDKDSEGKLINFLAIEYMGEYGEIRELNPETGEVGKLIRDWYQKLSWR